LSSDPNPLNGPPDQERPAPEIPSEILPPLPQQPAPVRTLSENPVWSGWDVALIVVVFMFALFAATFVALPVAKRFDSMRNMSATAVVQSPIVVITIEGIAELGVLLFMVFLVRTHYGQPFFAALRWNFPNIRWAAFLMIGLALALALAPFETGLEKIAPSPKQLPIDQMFSSTAAAYVMAMFGTFWAPFIEELFFRGFLYPVLARRLGVLVSVILTAIAFAALHGAQLAHAIAPLVVIFIVGLVLTIIRARNGSVASSVLVHMGYNGALFLMAWYGSDHFRHLEKLQ
jgi:membrane protease YdiL (CAAX protease family)